MTAEHHDAAPTARAVPRREWRDAVWSSDLSPVERLVALAYAEHAAADPSHVWVTGDRLRAMTGAARSTTRAALRRLEAAGWLTVTEPARQHHATRYALTIPSQGSDSRTPEGSGSRTSDAQGSESRTPEGSGSRTSEGSGSRTSESPGVRLPSPGVREPDPNQKNQLRMHAGAPSTTTTPSPDDRSPAPITTALASAPLIGTAAALASTIRGHRLGRHLPADVIAEHAHALAAARYDTRALEDALALEDFTGARNAGLLRHTLTKLARNPRPPATPPPAVGRRCERHGTSYATFCSSCLADVRAGDLAPQDAAGDLPAPFRTRASVPA